eukprot:12874288-Prorocentrum_lima.AAC.1
MSAMTRLVQWTGCSIPNSRYSRKPLQVPILQFDISSMGTLNAADNSKCAMRTHRPCSGICYSSDS